MQINFRQCIRNAATFLLEEDLKLNDKELALLADTLADDLKKHALHLYAQQTREPSKVVDPHVA